MRKFAASVAICTGVACTLLTSPSGAQSPPVNTCRVIPSRIDALDWPSKHAWDLFISLNHPAQPKELGRGLPDCTKPFGSPGSTAVWETWRNAGSEVYLADGREPPPWDDTSLPDEKPGLTPTEASKAQAEFTFHGAAALANKDGSPHVLFSPSDGVFDNAGGFGETRLNQTTYEFIRQQCLYSRNGQQRYAKALADGKKPPIQFPTSSVEVKAAWLDFDKEGIPIDKQSTYYTANYKGKKYGLVALHIITKDIPVWFWASFHHKDAPANSFEQPDSFGPPSEINSTVWSNYRLGGTQVDFVLPTGTPSFLSDHYVEFGFQRSSCISCHATATISQQTPMPSAQQKAICSLSPNLPEVGLSPTTCRKLIGDKAFEAGSDQLVAERGPPYPEWFEKDGKPFYLQTDFVWSIPFRGRLEKAPPPPRCVW